MSLLNSGKILSVLLLLLLCLTALSQAQTLKTGTGDFDISKVREAVEGQSDSTISSFSPLQKKAESYSAIIFRIIIYLVVVIVLIFGVAWIMRKTGIAGSSRIGGGGAMDVLEVLPFGQNRNTVLIRVMDTVYLLGQSANSIVLLEKIEGQKAIDLIASTKGGGSVMQFKDAFNSFIGKIKKTT